jgi:hypothetical protein
MMSESTIIKSGFHRKDPNRPVSLRAQLVWSALFPLAVFVLLSVLVATGAFRQ